MAHLKLGAIVTECRGKLGGQSLQMQGGRCFLLTNSKPKNRQSNKTFNIGRRHQFYMSAWKTLTASQRKLWNKKAEYFRSIGGSIFSKSVTGIQLFYVTNTKYFYGLGLFFNTPPSYAPIKSMTIASIDLRVSVVGVRVNISRLVTANEVLTLYASPPCSRGIERYRGSYNYVGSLTPGASTGINCISQYIADYGAAPKVGTKVFFRLCVSNGVTGSFTPYSYGSGIVS